MKISRLHVRGFGKIENYSTEFSDGLNVVYGPNESGKSTLMAFIKATLYGAKGGRTSKDGLAAAAKRYMPWNNAVYGGYMNFELDDGRLYRIDRAFENGTVKLYDDSFNDITEAFADGRDISGIAEKLIGLNESLFERTVYISQLGTRIDTSASKDLIERISNIRQSGSEDISIKKATAALNEALKQQVGTDRSYTRPLDIINKRLEELQATKKTIQNEKKEKLECKLQLEEISQQLSKLSEKEKLVLDLIEFCTLKDRHKVLFEKSEQIRFLNEEIKLHQKNISSMAREKELLEQELTKKIDSQKSKIKTMDICSILSLVSAICVGWGAFVFNALSPWFTLVPLILTAIFVFLRVKNSSIIKAFKDEELEAYAQRLDQVLHQQMIKLNERITDEKIQMDKLSARLESQTVNFNTANIKALENEIDRMSEKISGVLANGSVELTPAEQTLLDNAFERHNESIGAELYRLREYIAAAWQKKNVEYASLQATLKRDDNVQDEEKVDREVAMLMLQKKTLEQRGKALNIAITTLEECASHVQKKYIPVMNKVFKSTFSSVTAQKYSDIRAGDNLNIMLNDPKSELVVPVTMLSNGTIDQMYLALRIAISETVLKINERLPFIMDEPFAQYDDERTFNALKCIYDISKNQQVIIFTCKKREVELIKNLYPCKICSLT